MKTNLRFSLKRLREFTKDDLDLQARSMGLRQVLRALGLSDGLTPQIAHGDTNLCLVFLVPLLLHDRIDLRCGLPINNDC